LLHLRSLPAAIVAFACAVVSGCVAPLGPGYLVEKQKIELQFLAGSGADQPPRIQVQATYNLRNTGNRSLSALEARLPGGRRVQPHGLQALWDGSAVDLTPAPDARRNASLTLPASWPMGERRTLKISYEIASAPEG